MTEHVTFATIVLNAMPWIRFWLLQHYRLADRIVIVEGADRRYPSDRVTAAGLSTDGTAEAIRSFPDPEGKIELIQHGWADDKAEIRDRYAQVAKVGLLAVPDSDEFIDEATWRSIVAEFQKRPRMLAFAVPIIHFWQPPGSVWTDGWPFSRRIVVGGYADIPHTRFYRVNQLIRYGANHNQPELRDGRELVIVDGRRTERRLTEVGDRQSHEAPFIWHFGFCINENNGADKNRFYLNRGEATTRKPTTEFRAAWLRGETPRGSKILHWNGGHPDCFNHAADVDEG